MITELSTRTVKSAWVFLAAFVVGAIVLGLRFPDRIFDPQFRDEDGFIFFRQEAIAGIKSFAGLYSGYLHTLQRAIAYVAGFVHPLWAPWVYNWATFIITAAACGRIAIAGLPAAWRFGFAALFLLHPFSSWNAIQLTNVFWFTAALFPLFAIERPPASRFGRAATIGIAGVLGLSGPFAAFFAPLFVLRALLLDRSRYTLTLGATVLATGIVQALLLFTSKRFGITTDTGTFHLVDVWTLANRLVVKSFFVRFADESSAVQSVIAFAILGLFAAGAVMAARRSMERDERIRIAMLIAGAGLMYLAGIFGTLGPWLNVMPGGDNTRYYLLPYLLLGWAVIAIACVPGHHRWMRAPAAALMLAATLTVFRAPPLPPSLWAKDLHQVERNGYGFVRLNPAGGHHQLFMARGEGRFGFARGRELGLYHDVNRLLPRAFGLSHAYSVSMDATVYVYLQQLGDREGIVVFPRSIVGIVIPDGAASFSGSYAFAPLAIPPGSLDRIAGGDGIVIQMMVSDGVKHSRVLHKEFMLPASPYDPAARRQFRVEIPPGPWKALFIHNLAGPTDGHTTLYDFSLWADLAFQEK